MGLTNREAAQTLGLSTYTVQTYSSDLLAKLGVKNRQKPCSKQLPWGSARSRAKEAPKLLWQPCPKYPQRRVGSQHEHLQNTKEYPQNHHASKQRQSDWIHQRLDC